MAKKPNKPRYLYGPKQRTYMGMKILEDQMVRRGEQMQEIDPREVGDLQKMHELGIKSPREKRLLKQAADALTRQKRTIADADNPVRITPPKTRSTAKGPRLRKGIR